MSRTDDARSHLSGRFPRVSGDEPLTATSTLGTGKFSPRERG